MFQFVSPACATDTGEHDDEVPVPDASWIITSFAVMRRESLTRIGRRPLPQQTTGSSTTTCCSRPQRRSAPPTWWWSRQRAWGLPPDPRGHLHRRAGRLPCATKNNAIHGYDVIYQDVGIFEDRLSPIAEANQIGRLLTSRGIVATSAR